MTDVTSPGDTKDFVVVVSITDGSLSTMTSRMVFPAEIHKSDKKLMKAIKERIALDWATFKEAGHKWPHEPTSQLMDGSPALPVAEQES